MNINDFGHNSFVTWTVGLIERIKKMENDWDYECQTCGCRITVSFDQLYPPYKCPECGSTWSFLSREIIEEDEIIDAIEERQWPKDE